MKLPPLFPLLPLRAFWVNVLAIATLAPIPFDPTLNTGALWFACILLVANVAAAVWGVWDYNREA